MVLFLSCLAGDGEGSRGRVFNLSRLGQKFFRQDFFYEKPIEKLRSKSIEPQKLCRYFLRGNPLKINTLVEGIKLWGRATAVLLGLIDNPSIKLSSLKSE
jgi:hypothetical protein